MSQIQAATPFSGMNIVPDKYCPLGQSYAFSGAWAFDGINVFPDRPLGQTYRMPAEPLEVRLKSLVAKMSRLPMRPDTILMNPRDYEALQRALADAKPILARPMTSAMQVSIVAAVTVGALGWMIARRNALADQQDSESWAAEIVGKLVALVKGLLGLDKEVANV